ncbi:MAG: AAA family ATPase [Clostridium sp.]|nr:AAA family ATPase [Clostridium sp.]
MKQNNFGILRMLIRPYDPSSKLRHTDGPAEHLYDTRSDFLLFKHQTHLSVLLTIYNELPFRRTRRPKASGVITVRVRDNETGEILSGRSEALSISSDYAPTLLRCDLPFDYSMVSPMHTYTVEAIEEGIDDPLYSREILFYDLPGIRMLPTRWYEIENGWFTRWFSFDRETFTNPGDEADEVKVHFRLRSPLDLTKVLRHPEVSIRVVAPDGSETVRETRPNSDTLPGLTDDEATPATIFVEEHISLDPKRRGVWYIELRCMGYAVGSMLINTAAPARGGVWDGSDLEKIPDYTPAAGLKAWDDIESRWHAEGILRYRDSDEDSAFDSMIGLTDVKEKLRRHADMARFRMLRSRKSLPAIDAPLHAIFAGSPGTGKTTVAKLLGAELRRCGVLSKGHVVVRERSTLVGRYYGDEEKAIREALEEARGGILFIDEAYQLNQPQDPRDPARFVIESLMTALADESDRDWMLILAGYTDPVLKMLEMNPGLSSRIPATNHYIFPDYTAAELTEIAMNYLDSHGFRLTPGADARLRERIISDLAACPGKDLGNGRYVMNLIQTEILPATASRVVAMSNPTVRQLSLIVEDDIPRCRPAEIAGDARRIGFAV